MKDNRPFCTYSFATARELDNVIAWRQSLQANIDCSNAIKDVINNNYNGICGGKELPKEVIGIYGKARVSYVLANTILLRKNDRRISDENREWAKMLNYSYDENSRDEFLIYADSGLINLFTRQHRQGEKQAEKKRSKKGYER